MKTYRKIANFVQQEISEPDIYSSRKSEGIE
jgi:hypothetical protein